ncbi:putative secreted protein (Por secretion system target) [Gillisia sp. Hel_I_86]|uniref:T9SS type A sorting domain-containing protein n=1 Tax=Gillisia sp. Hel_I_86 TaxID=1249981 RepID=UPI00119B3A15|nr:T9SS type A sorting domain-containing protein [Gillisia sp. Hel_I_86]TVZ25905.1 putative secreted protein (Por secretion system target) [Gillisia sp. Hel_I_86]
MSLSKNSTIYNMDVYDFSGNKVIDDHNLTEDEKDKIISELPKGYYIIKTQEEKTVKIRKN